jgi:hypothetical protein
MKQVSQLLSSPTLLHLNTYVLRHTSYSVRLKAQQVISTPVTLMVAHYNRLRLTIYDYAVSSPGDQQ